MIGFGDCEHPNKDSVDLLEQYLIEFVQNLAVSSFKRSKRRGFAEIKMKDLIAVLKNNKKMYFRVPTILQFIKSQKSANNEDSVPRQRKRKSDK